MTSTPSDKQWNVISLGGGVQSSTMALMASHGALTPMPDFAVFADTQDEPASVYKWLDWLEKRLPFPVHRVTKGRLSEAVLTMRTTEDGRVFSKTSVPLHVLNNAGERSIITHRNCTKDYKIAPIQKKVRELCGIKRGQKTQTVTQWIGISLDEQQRMKDSRDKWCVNRFPLVDMRITRWMCKEWMSRHGYPEAPKSACVYCPFKDAVEFRRMQIDEPNEFAKAVAFERELNAKRETQHSVSKLFVYRSCKPLDKIDFRSDVEHGQQLLSFMDECDGMCGV